MNGRDQEPLHSYQTTGGELWQSEAGANRGEPLAKRRATSLSDLPEFLSPGRMRDLVRQAPAQSRAVAVSDADQDAARLIEQLPPRSAGSRGRRVPVAEARLAERMTDRPQLLTVDETAELLRTSRAAVYALIARGQLPGVTRIGRRVLIRRDDLLEWLRHKSAPSLKE